MTRSTRRPTAFVASLRVFILITAVVVPMLVSCSGTERSAATAEAPAVAESAESMEREATPAPVEVAAEGAATYAAPAAPQRESLPAPAPETEALTPRAYRRGSVVEIAPFSPELHQAQAVDADFMRAYIQGNPTMIAPSDDPVLTTHHFYWGSVEDESFGPNRVIAEIAGVDVMEYSLYLLQFDDAGLLISTLPLASYARFSDSEYRMTARIGEERIDTTAATRFPDYDVPEHINPVIERSYQAGRGQGGHYSELVTGKYYMPNPHGIPISRAMETEFFYAFETQPQRPRMFILGWSHGGNIAYITEYFVDGIGAVFYSWHIDNVVHTASLWSRRESEESALERMTAARHQPQSPEAFIEYFQANIESFSPVLREFEIIADTAPIFQPFPLQLEGEEITVTVDENRAVHPMFETEHVSGYMMTVQRADRYRNIHRELNMEGAVLGIRPIGGIRSPLNPNLMAVVSAWVHRGWEGPPNSIELRTTGADLDF